MAAEARVDLGGCVDLFCMTPGVGVAVVSREGEIVYHNSAATRLYFGDPSLDVRGKRLDELFPEEWVRQRSEVLRRVFEERRPAMLRSIMRGRQIESTILPIRSGATPERVLVVAFAGRTPNRYVPDEVEIVESETADLGPLDALTTRELQVLSLIGQGKSAREIGEVLGCSPRTVERHRDTIGRKLERNDRVQLALIAQAAGLELADAELKRVRPVVGKQRGDGTRRRSRA